MIDEFDNVNIRHIKLSTGEELIGVVLTDTPDRTDVLYVQKPMLIKTYTDSETISFLFYEWQPLAESDVCFINPLHIISHVECSAQVKEQYLHVVLNNPDPPPDGMESETDQIEFYEPDETITYH